MESRKCRFFSYLGCKSICIPILFISLQSCAKSEFGQQLANSFNEPSEQVLSRSKLSSDELPAKKSELETVSNKKRKQSISKNDSIELNSREEKISRKILLNPQPYRIIIKVTKADPSAPAEVVTNALRRAGVRFEVEMIERVNDTDSYKNSSRERRGRS